ncbi:MAG TPA: hypothetical protein VNE60_03250, partial [Gemmatimonadaceae bacterium]|nr:hypothetical protein [Gemmatimonadaceae bacterium]
MPNTTGTRPVADHSARAPQPTSQLTPWELICKVCRTPAPAGPTAICEHCLGPLEAQPPSNRTLPDKQTIAARAPNLWRYREWLPFTGTPTLSLDTGFTPLVDAPRLAAKLGVARCWIKNDAVSHP